MVDDVCDSVDGVRFIPGRAGAELTWLFTGPNLPLPVAFNVGIPPFLHTQSKTLVPLDR